MGKLPWIEPAEQVAEPVIAIVDLLRYHGHKVNCKPLQRIDAVSVHGFMLDELRIKSGVWLWSLTDVVDRLSGQVGDAYRPDWDQKPGGEEPPEGWTPPGGISLERLEARDVPRAELVLKWAIASGLPVAIGIGITDDFEDVAEVVSGEIRVPRAGHIICDGSCLVLVGWDDGIHSFACRGTYGSNWGVNGYGWIPYQYVCQPLWTHEALVVISV